MPSVLRIKQTMVKKGIPAEVMSQFDFPGPKDWNRAESQIALINQMDTLLSPAQRLAVMEEQGCCKTGKGDVAHRTFGREHADKTIAEKVKLLNEANDMPHRAPCRLNDDDTLSVYWGFGPEGQYGCVCGMIRKLSKPINVSSTFCGCCGGHIRHNYQNSLGVKLRLKKVVSSAVSTGGKKHCEFLFEIGAPKKQPKRK